MADVNVYEELSHERLAALPTVFRDGLFAGQVVLVTGGAGGIGRAVCPLVAVVAGDALTTWLHVLDGAYQTIGQPARDLGPQGRDLMRKASRISNRSGTSV